jgi:hypothetical protein
MSLVDSITTSYDRHGVHHVRVAGLELWTIVSGTVSFSLDSPVPTATLTLSEASNIWSSHIKRGDPVTVDWEYDGFTKRIFTGFVKRRQHQTGQAVLDCVGQTNKLYRPFQVLPITFSGVTATAAVQQILATVGITNSSLNITTWLLGTIQPAVIDLKSPGDAIQHIIEVDGHRQFELPSGTFVVIPLLEVPAPSPFRTYDDRAGMNPRILDISDDEDEDQVKKKVYVSGATLSTTDPEGNITQTQIGGPDHPIYAQTTSNDLVAGDPELYSMQYQNDLIQDTAKGGVVALRLLDKYHRVVETISLKVPLDPQIQLAQTIGIIDPTITGRWTRWFVNGYTHSWSADSADTELDLFGGDQSGTTGNLAPIADFVWLPERELIGTGEKLVVSFVSAAYDLDGSIVDLHWTDDYPGTPMNQHGADMTVVTRVYDPLVATTVNVTQAATDNDGLIGTTTKAISIPSTTSQGSQAVIPNIAAAAYNTHMLTPDGGFSWWDQACSSGHTINVAAFNPIAPGLAPILLFGTDNGQVLRSTDALATAPTLVMTAHLNSPINALCVDYYNPGRAYVGTEAGYLYRTDDAGTTWITVQAALGYPIKSFGLISPGRLYCFGGAVTASATTWPTLGQWSDDAGVTFTSAPIGGELGTDLAGASGTYTAIVAAACIGNEMCIGLLGTGSLDPRIYYTTTFHDDATGWKRAIGITPGLAVPRAMAPNLGGAGRFVLFFDNTDSWITTDGINWTKQPGVLLPGETVYDLAFTGYQDVFIGAAGSGLVKSTDNCLTVNYIRPIGGISTWPAGAHGRKVCFIPAGTPLNCSLLASARAGVTATRLQTLTRSGSSQWTKESDEATAYLYCPTYRFQSMTAGILFRCRNNNGADGAAWQTLQRSTDNGLTWSNTSVTRCSCVDIDSNGYLWAIGAGADSQPHNVYKSTDAGVTWVLVYTDAHTYFGAYPNFSYICVDPNNPLRIMAIGTMGNMVPGSTAVVAVTSDGGVVWTRQTPTFPSAPVRTAARAVVLVAGTARWITAYLGSGGTHYLLYSDNDGFTWTLGYSFTGANTQYWIQSIRVGLQTYFLCTASGGNPAKILRTTNNGVTFAEVAPAIITATALAYDGTQGILYVGTNTDATPVWGCFCPQDSGNTWQDYTGNFAAATGFTGVGNVHHVAFAGLAVNR